MTPQHNRAEFHQNASGRRAWAWANRKLAELQTEPEGFWRNHLIRCYLGNLKSGHKLGVEGSLLAMEVQS